MSEDTTSPAVSAAEQAEIDRVAGLTDAQVLKESGDGKFGPGIVGKHLAARAAGLMKASSGGKLGPAIMEHDFAAKQAAKRAAAQKEGDAGADTVETEGDDPEDEEDEGEFTGDVDPKNLKDPRNPWSYVTLSGAKVLAQEAQVSYKPAVKRPALIAQLQAAGVVPPAIPEEEGEGDKKADGGDAPE
jgi:hypothetical protein